jgi:hypothetical protein
MNSPDECFDGWERAVWHAVRRPNLEVTQGADVRILGEGNWLCHFSGSMRPRDANPTEQQMPQK